MNYVDLFAGIGGFALGAYWAGWRFDRHYFSEIDPWCCRLYQQRFPDAVPLGDITKIDGRAFVADAQSQRWRLGVWRRSSSSFSWGIAAGGPTARTRQCDCPSNRRTHLQAVEGEPW
ncbi:MAG: DNA cytosine methyltransferase [Actinomycetia bacterium]|nr:DNA cytosine methyltransferase [Actinomycetes bacterium]